MKNEHGLLNAFKRIGLIVIAVVADQATDEAYALPMAEQQAFGF